MTRKEELAQSPSLQDELRRMQNGEPYDAHTPEMREWRDEVKKLLNRLNNTEYHADSMADITREILPNAAPDIYVEPPFYCDYGNLIKTGEKVFINFGCIILDGGGVTIGDRCVIGAGSVVVVKDIPADSLAVGNPARVIRKLNQE